MRSLLGSEGSTVVGTVRNGHIEAQVPYWDLSFLAIAPGFRSQRIELSPDGGCEEPLVLERESRRVTGWVDHVDCNACVRLHGCGVSRYDLSSRPTPGTGEFEVFTTREACRLQACRKTGLLEQCAAPIEVPQGGDVLGLEVAGIAYEVGGLGVQMDGVSWVVRTAVPPFFAGDEFVSLNGDLVPDTFDIQWLHARALGPIGSDVPVTVLRGGAIVDLVVVREIFSMLPTE